MSHMSSLECPFCGTRLASSYSRCPHCYKSLMLYFPDAESQTPDSTSPVRTQPAVGHTMWMVALGAPILVMVLLLFLVWS